MSLFNARNNNQGFTLIETLVIVIIIGILSAIAAPSFLSMFNRNKVNDAFSQVQGALQEAQREAIRKSKTCTVYIPDSTSLPNTATQGITQVQIISNCFTVSDGTSKDLTTINIPNYLPLKKVTGVAIKSNVSSTNPKQIMFSFRGNTISSGKIVLYAANVSNQEKKCLAISNGLGIIRTGNYTGSTSSDADITAGTCNTSE